ncbi:MAG TPA: ATP-binding cassette domain-containing protein [bacterium]|nr:ATP-binding cassette domain-containing protein [bacterium]
MMIQLFHLTKVHPSGVKVLEDAFLTVAEGAFVVLAGENRAGKSTLLRILAGEDKPTSGRALIHQKDPYALSPKEKREWQSLNGFIFPDLKLFPDKTVEENVLFPLRVRGSFEADPKAPVAQLLERAGLGAKAGQKPADLSAAEQRMGVALRAMVFKPRLLLADDPFAGMDEKSARTLWKLFAELHKAGTTVFLSLQRPEDLASAGDLLNETRVQMVHLKERQLWPVGVGE